MASQATDLADVCAVCLESRPLKFAGNKCKHRFCSKCLYIVFESKKGNVFACPTCKVDCLCPMDGVEGLVDFTGGGEEVDDAGLEQGCGDSVKDSRVVPELGVGLADPEITKKQGNETTGAEYADAVLDVRCKPCRHRKNDVQAVNLCIECGHLYICDTCTDMHGQNKVTRGHVVVPLRSEKTEKKTMCKDHDLLLNSYCQDCEKSVCMMCVMWEHGEHSVENLGDFVDGKVEALNRVLEGRANRLRELQHQMYELMALKGEAPLLDKQGTLIKEIEDHADQCIAQIVKWKDDLKKQVRADHKVIRDVPEVLEKVKKAVEQLQRPGERVMESLGKKEHHPLYLDKLLMVQQEVAVVADVGDDIEETGHYSQLRELHDYEYDFIPGELPSNLGKMEKKSRKYNSGDGFNDQNVKVIFEHTIQTDSNDCFIPCVVNLGFNYAVAHPTPHGEPSGAIDVYELPGTLKRTLKDHVPPIYDMSSTTDGTLAVLSDGSGGINCRVKLFDVESGYLSCTGDIDIAKPLSLGVTFDHQYAILGTNGQGETQILIADKEGVVLAECRCVIGDEIYENPRIRCSRDVIVVGAKNHVAIHQLKDAKLQSVKTNVFKGSLTDISATVWNDFFRVCVRNRLVKLTKNTKKSGDGLDWTYGGNVTVSDKEVTGSDEEARLSTKDGHIVVTHGQTIRVFKLLP